MIRTVAIIIYSLLMQISASGAEEQDIHFSGILQSGTNRNRHVVEASGRARSHLISDRLWAVNDHGSKPRLFAFGSDGKAHGSVSLSHAENFDWEDLASFEHDGKPWLLIADIGDNEARRTHCTLYLVEEPAVLRRQKLKPAREIRFAYPDGSLDAESVAVDITDDSILILAKRTVPARLYRVPLHGDDERTYIAERLGDVASIPQPSQLEIDRALADQSWHWQPTAMDIAPDGSLLAILTYQGAYLYVREPVERWLDALQKSPVRLDIGGIELAEAVAFGNRNGSLFVTVEGRRPPLYRFDRN
jgi:hypothetical protein